MGKGEGNTKLAMEVSEENLGKEFAKKNEKHFQNYSRISTAVIRKEIAPINEKLKSFEDISDRLSQTNNQKYELAKMDCKIVHGEIIDIKTCRTNIFMGTLGVIGTVGVGILGIAGLKGGSTSSFQSWLPIASAIPILLLITAILATIHKARGITIRVGYIRAVFENLVKRKTPDSFCGWFTAKSVIEKCQYYLKQRQRIINNCPDAATEKCTKYGKKNKENMHDCPIYEQVEPNTEMKFEPYCVAKARQDSWKLNEGVKSFPPFLYSFTSFSTYIYSITFVFAVLTLLITMFSTLEKALNSGNIANNKTQQSAMATNNIEDINNVKAENIVETANNVKEIKNITTKTYWTIVIISMLLTLSLGSINLKYKIKSYQQSVKMGRREKGTNIGYAFKIYTYLSLGLFPAFLGVLLWAVFDKELESMRLLQIFGVYGFVFVVVALLGVISTSCYDKVYSLRKGRYSIERWYCLWKTCLEDCPLMKIAQEESESK